jgi:hypothetical protein
VIVTSPLLAGLARSGALASPTDRLSDLDVANAISPVVVLPLPLDTLNEPAITSTVQQVSVRKSDSNNRTNLASIVDTVFLTLSKGLWRINVQASIAANFVLVGSTFFAVKMQYPGSAQTIKLVGLLPCGGASVTTYVGMWMTREIDVLIPLDGAQITQDIPASNGVVTNNIITQMDVLCTKLA